ncbi:MAG: hypothetical protein IT350_10030 [Deltaproteobacteria bacterium]|nr:hypothetical protein [Deltaproteobacteria bacterium]
MASTLKIRVSFLLALVAALTVFGCAANQVQSPDSEMQGLGNQDSLMREPLNDPPSYALLHKSLEFYEQKLGVKFFKNEKDRYMPYTSSTWRSFAIADHLNDCLWTMQMKGLIGFRSLEGKYSYIIEMDAERGGCGVVGDDADSQAKDLVSIMETSVVTPSIRDQINRGVNFCSGEKFIQDVLQLPYKIRIRGESLENAVSRHAAEVRNPLDIAYGDLVFFTEYYGERNIAVYVGNGVIVYNSCFRADPHRLNTNISYRVYRLYSGFGAINYRMSTDVFMREIVGRPDL